MLTGWTHHYMLEELTVGQLMLYYRLGIEFKYGKPKPLSSKKTSEMTPDELREERDRLRELYGMNVEGM